MNNFLKQISNGQNKNIVFELVGECAEIKVTYDFVQNHFEVFYQIEDFQNCYWEVSEPMPTLTAAMHALSDAIGMNAANDVYDFDLPKKYKQPNKVNTGGNVRHVCPNGLVGGDK